MPEHTQRCYCCDKDKPVAEFNWANRAKGIRHKKCRDCFRVYNRERYEKKGDHIRTVVTAYRRAHRETIAAAKRAAYQRDLEANRARERARAAITNADPSRQAAKRAWARADRATHPEKWAAKYRREYDQNPQRFSEASRRRRALKLAASVQPLSADLLSGRWEFFGGRCWMCRTEAVEWDHVKPLSKGGAHCLSNLRPACRSCNASKRDRWPVAS